MPLPDYIQLANTFGQWVQATNNLISHVDNTSVYILVSQNATPRISTGNVSLNGTMTVATVNATGTVTANLFSGNGASLISLNATALATGTVDSARLPVASTTANGIVDTTTQSFAGDKTFTNNVTVNGTITGNVTGTVSNATNLNSQPASFYTNASNLSTGTLPLARLDANVILTTSTTGINASALSAGTVPLARLTSANTTANGIVDTNIQSFAGNKTFTNNVTVSGAATFSNTVSITGAANALGTVGITGAANALGTLGVTGATTLANTLSITGAANALGTLGVTGATNALGTLGVTGTLTALGQLVVTTNATFDTTTLFVDTTNHRVGVGTTTPGYKLEVNGAFAATTKSFSIPHPLDPAKTLRYGSLEGPENGVYVRGKSQSLVIDLPDYWMKLVDASSISVSLTPIGYDQRLYVKSSNTSQVVIGITNTQSGGTLPLIEYYYTIYAERIDVPKLQVEVTHGEQL